MQIRPLKKEERRRTSSWRVLWGSEDRSDMVVQDTEPNPEPERSDAEDSKPCVVDSDARDEVCEVDMEIHPEDEPDEQDESRSRVADHAGHPFLDAQSKRVQGSLEQIATSAVAVGRRTMTE